jgi:serine/threonine protein kinase
MVDHIGQQIGNYRLVRLLGQGGFADVYLGEHMYLNTTAAIKILHTRLANDDIEHFRQEARSVAHLQHPHIIHVFDFGVEGTLPYLIMSNAPHGTLRQRHPKGTQLPLPLVVTYVNQIASALQYAHDQNVIHRDVKPENLLVAYNNEILLSDFGIAVISQSSHLQSTKDMAGTIAYMAPEQIAAHPRPASDQYSLGIVVYEWLTGERPFNGSFTEIAAKQSLVPPPPLREKLPNTSPVVEQVVMTALSKDPKSRFTSVKAFATALEQSSQATPFSSYGPFNADTIASQKSHPVEGVKISPPTPPMKTRFFIGGLILLLLLSTTIGLVGYQSHVNQINENATATTTTQLRATTIAQTRATSTTIAENANLYSSMNAKVVLNDPLHDNSRGYKWDEGTVSDGSFCKFIDTTYHANQTNPSYFHQCIAEASDFSNFTFEIQMTILKGGGGMIFRADNATGKWYNFFLLQNGQYTLIRSDGFGASGQTLAGGSSSAIKTGLNQSNLIAVVANGPTFDLYVNHQKIASANDTTYSHGAIGVLAFSAPAEVVYSSAKVWI